MRWAGQVEVPATGAYRFRTVPDDIGHLTVNGVQPIDNWIDHATTTNTGASINLIAGTKYQMTMEFYGRSGDATAKLSWKTPDQTAFVLIPVNRLYNGG